MRMGIFSTVSAAIRSSSARPGIPASAASISARLGLVLAGKPAYFIRLGGCDVGCRWCDAKMTWNPRLYPPVEVDSIVERACSYLAQAIVITGGSPRSIRWTI